MKKIVDDAFVALGMIFLVLIVASYFTEIGDFVHNGRTYLLVLFIAIIIGRYLRLIVSAKRHSKG
ncbi:hypothetical protein PWEIH_06416 [Listeria weihenstephanensis FSL R9-0317]|uniref:Uncharacterized protein n=1 Tax=Listeria weihenstephanensis TaxID=1006155 RepID=A0A1S7FRD4_9LIST|nr:hypothetical protein [Listeria weihenstephanensis]AQY49952.1 hypothetical protein UE46_02085 [Listeria weihenstephanensis]EUJ39699.1 hypothetical protein PWEIH_06416 [Listeria weihenstephanensis FSL R9-0317]MBC1499697.1 hypothetical protein [Listeria weihenstephanensis]